MMMGGGGGETEDPDPQALLDYLFDQDYTETLEAAVTAAEQGEVFVSAPIEVEYVENDVTAIEPREVESDPPDIVLELLPRRHEEIVPGTLRFVWGGDTYHDRGDGTVYRIEDGEEIAAGDVYYAEGTVDLQDIAQPGGDTVTIERMLTSRETLGQESFYFRVPGAPVRPGSLSISAHTVTGDHITIVADEAGVLSHDKAGGWIDPQTGIVYLSFGEEIPAANMDLDNPPPWYHDGLLYTDPNDGNDYVHRPIRCIPQDVRFSAVILRYIPLEAEILGLDPVRLPQDGRGPIYRPGDVVVIADPQTEQLAEGVSASSGM